MGGRGTRLVRGMGRRFARDEGWVGLGKKKDEINSRVIDPFRDSLESDKRVSRNKATCSSSK